MKKISHKLWAGMMALVFFITVSLAAFQVFFLKDFFVSSKVKSVSSNVYGAVNGQDMSSASGIFAKLDSLAYSEDIGLEIVDAKGESIYINGQSQKVGVREMKSVALLSGKTSSGNGGGSSDNGDQGGAANGGSGSAGQGYGKGGIIQEGQLRQQLIQNGLEGKNTVQEIVHPVYGFEVMVLSIPFKSADGKNYVALATIPLAPIDEMIGIMNRVLAVAAMLLILLSGILAYLISRNITRPLNRLTAAAGEIEQGNLEARVSIKSRDETGALGRTFNRMADRLQKTERFRTEIIENVSHELRTPLSIIKGYAELIRDVTGENKSKRDSQLEVISQEADRLGVIVDDILDYSQIQSGLVELNVTSFDISEMIRGVIRKYQLVLDESSMKINYNGPESVYVKGDKVRIEQILQNLVKNAINYSPEGKNIDIKVMDEGEKAFIEVGDHGAGIPEEELEFIWDRYYRTKGIKKKNIYGSGLGLSIVKSILDAHGATCSVESKEGEGTTFRFSLDKVQKNF
ncbi:MAG: sensor histidine kinase [Clostridiaceae bacterium]